jgi:hypothetical protein
MKFTYPLILGRIVGSYVEKMMFFQKDLELLYSSHKRTYIYHFQLVAPKHLVALEVFSFLLLK